MDDDREKTRPVPDVTLAGKWILVSLPKHEIDVLNDGTVVRTITHFSTGRQGHLTPLISHGEIDHDRRYRVHHSSTYKDASGHPAAMPFALFFQGGCAFHAGDPDAESHGCIHLERDDAEWLFEWVGHDDVHLGIVGPRPSTDLKRA
jgi:hypothetical protein